MDFFSSDKFEKWCWIELIGFDNTSPDYGVSDFLDRAGFLPTGVTFLLPWLGFVFDHTDLEQEKPIATANCSYLGHEYCPERRRQDWTTRQLKGLIDALHTRGVKVYLSYFNLSSYTDDADVSVSDPFHARHPEVLEKGTTFCGSVNVLKRLNDGTYYEDILQEKTIKVLEDYTFDGLQIADGISSARLTLPNCIDRDDLLAQFSEATGIQVPADADPTTYIQENCYLDWAYFNTKRWKRFFEKFYKRLSSAGKQAFFNNAWTCGPFDALYRYGVDYRPMPSLGATHCMAEDVSAGIAILSDQQNGYLMTDEERRRMHYYFLSKLMFTKASMDTVHVCPLVNIHDNMEQWGVLEHMPASMVRAAASNMNTYIYTSSGVQPIIHGPYYCLCDSLSSQDWDFIRATWNNAFTQDVYGAAGVTVVWSDERVDRELQQFRLERRTPTVQIVTELLYASAPISGVVRVEDIPHMPEPMGFYSGTLLVTNPDLLSEEELTQIVGCGHILLAICPADKLPGGFTVLVRERNSFADIVLAVHGSSTREELVITNNASYEFDSKKDQEPLNGLWTHFLAHRPYSNEFWIACSDVIAELSGAPILRMEVTTEFGVRRRICKSICIQKDDPARCRIILTNDDYWYNHPQINLGRKIQTAVCPTKYPGYKVSVKGSALTTLVPCRGVEIIDVTLAPQ